MSKNLFHRSYRFNHMWQSLHCLNVILNKLDNLKLEKPNEIGKQNT